MTLLLQLMPLAHAPSQRDWLDPGERTRLAAISHAGRAAQFIAGHCLARQLAAEAAGGEAAQWRYTVAADGRRRLVHAQHASLYVSISHTRHDVAVAVGTEPLGVDLEAVGRTRDWLALARTVFSPAEVGALAATPTHERDAAFLVTWTLKEAWAKRSGLGLQRQTARRCTAMACTAPEAEAWTWRRPDGGSLALATTPGAMATMRERHGDAQPWRFEHRGD